MITLFKNYESKTDENGIITYVGTILDDNTFVYSVVFKFQMFTLDMERGTVRGKVTYSDSETTNSYAGEFEYCLLHNNPNRFAEHMLFESDKDF